MSTPDETPQDKKNILLERIKTGQRNLSQVDLRGSDLSGANLRGSDLNGADLSGADLHGANLSVANLSEANFENAIVLNARFGQNQGIDETLKAALIEKGAIFEDSPGDRSRVLTPV